MVTASGQRLPSAISMTLVRSSPEADIAALWAEVAHGPITSFWTALGRSDLPFKGDMRQQADSVASANVELLPRLPITLGQFGRSFGGIVAKVDDQVPLACFRLKVVVKLGYVMRILRERARSHHAVKHERC